MLIVGTGREQDRNGEEKEVLAHVDSSVEAL
jgi:hypothetical protein